MTDPNDNPILLACSIGGSEILSALLKHRLDPIPDPNQPDEEGLAPLAHALQNHAIRKDPKLIHGLIKLGCNPDFVAVDRNDRGDWDPNLRCYKKMYVHAAELALASGAAVASIVFDAIGDARLSEIAAERPLLHRAVAARYYEIAERLLSRCGANPNFCDPRFGLPASKARDTETLDILALAGAKLTLEDASGKTPLESIYTESSDSALWEMAALIAKDEAGEKLKRGQRFPAPVERAMGAALIRAMDSKNKDSFASIWKSLGRKAALAVKSFEGRNLLHLAILAKQFPLAKRLLASGVDPVELDDSGECALSAFLSLSLDRSDKDPKGRRRRAFWAEFEKRIDWSRPLPNGSTPGEILWPVSIESRNGETVSSLAGRAWFGPAWRPFEAKPDGSSFLTRSAEIWMKKRGVFDGSSAACHSWDDPTRCTGFPEMLDQAVASGEGMTPDIAKRLGTILFGVNDGSAIFWRDYASNWRGREVSSRALGWARALEDFGADFASINKESAIAASVPALHAWFEELDLLAMETSTPTAAPSRPRAL